MSDKIEFQPIESSMFSHQHYDPNTRKLTVKFKNGLIYQYDDVGADKHAAFVENASPGSYFNKRIKGNHSGQKVDGRR